MAGYENNYGTATSRPLDGAVVDQGLRSYMLSVYNYMALGVALTGLVAYLFTRDKRSKSKCSGACAKAWPPIKTRRRPVAGNGLRQADVGTTKRRGGARMVTYKGHPLYFYEHDGPGEILCNDVVEFGGSWFVVNKKGKPG